MSKFLKKITCGKKMRFSFGKKKHFRCVTGQSLIERGVVNIRFTVDKNLTGRYQTFLTVI